MSEETHQQLVQHLYEASGDTLRGVVRYRDGSATPLYVREDVDTERFRRRVERTITRVGRVAGGDDEEEPESYPVELFDGVVVFCLQEGPSAGTVVAVDSILARNVASVVRECREALSATRSETPATA